MIVDCHGHYTTAPPGLKAFRDLQVAALADPSRNPDRAQMRISDDEIRGSLEGAQLRLQRERGIDLTLFSPIAGQMAHHIGNAVTSQVWSEICNDLIHRVVQLYPDNYLGVCQLPQSPGVPPVSVIPELRRCVEQLGFVGCNLNPDPSGGWWRDAPLSDRQWYPLYEALCDLDVPAMIHVSGSCNACFHHTGAHYLNGDTTAFMQFLTSDVFRDFPALRIVIPHGGGAVPYHWGRYRGLAQDMGKPLLKDHLLRNIWFDTCVYHLPGIRLLCEVIPAENIVFATEMVGAVKGIDPETGYHFDDTKRYVDQVPGLTAAQRGLIFEGNARRVWPRINSTLDRLAATRETAFA